jgi:hypothetical protein
LATTHLGNHAHWKICVGCYFWLIAQATGNDVFGSVLISTALLTYQASKQANKQTNKQTNKRTSGR